MIPKSGHVTIRDLAEALDVSVMSVSRALNNKKGVSEKLGERILTKAKEMGYRPNPTMQAFRAAQGRKQGGFRETIALVAQCESREAWLQSGGRAQVMEYFKTDAAELGYEIDFFGFDADESSVRRLNQVLYTRGIRGVIFDLYFSQIPPALADNCNVAIVGAFAHSTDHQSHRVTNNHYHAMVEVMERLHTLGYRRPGLVINERISRLSEDRWLGAYRLMQNRLSDIENVEPCFRSKARFDDFEDWIQTQQPDVVICPSGDWILKRLRAMGYAVPADIGYCDLALPRANRTTSGMLQMHREKAFAVISTMSGLLLCNRLGRPRVPLLMEVKAEWFAGATICKQNA